MSVYNLVRHMRLHYATPRIVTQKMNIFRNFKNLEMKCPKTIDTIIKSKYSQFNSVFLGEYRNFKNLTITYSKTINIIVKSKYSQFKSVFMGEDWFIFSFLLSFPSAFIGSLIFTDGNEQYGAFYSMVLVRTVLLGFWPIGILAGTCFIVNKLKINLNKQVSKSNEY